MANVKMNNKETLEKIQAEIVLRLGKKISQQEILDKSVDFVYKRLEQFVLEEFKVPKLTKEILNRIKENAVDAPLAYPDKSDDELIYGL
ncbi:MAG: hypothetical protein ACTSPW_18910 [Promethearchaeota archaeon]